MRDTPRFCQALLSCIGTSIVLGGDSGLVYGAHGRFCCCRGVRTALHPWSFTSAVDMKHINCALRLPVVCGECLLLRLSRWRKATVYVSSKYLSIRSTSVVLCDRSVCKACARVPRCGCHIRVRHTFDALFIYLSVQSTYGDFGACRHEA